MGDRRKASADLEHFIDDTIRMARERGYNPSVFITMRLQHGTIPAISRLVRSGDVQSGFRRLIAMGLKDWSIEAAVLRFPEEFSRDDRECAAFRLSTAG
ncbi:MAG: hypothetical protein WAT70_15515 [Rhizobiaceae bacterium]